jgi:4'-phosphopantetheinyl transferase
VATAPEVQGTAWLPQHGQLDLPEDAVHVWQVELAAAADVVRRLASVLAPDEQVRAARFHFEPDSRQYIIVRGALRLLLAGYMNRQATALHFGYTEFGRPFLLRPDGQPETSITFNVSHSYKVALLTFARGMRIGIDVERVRPEMAGGRIAERFFSPREVAALRGLPAVEQPAAFFRCWTRKEAFVKARGAGLSLPLHSFDVSLVPGEPAVLLHVASDPAEVEQWTLRAVTPTIPGYAAALAVESRCFVLSCYHLTELEPLFM